VAFAAEANHLSRPADTKGLIRRCSQALAGRDKLLFDLTLSSQLFIRSHNETLSASQDRFRIVFDCQTADWRQSPERQSGEEAPCLAAHLVQSDNHREAPWFVMKCAREFWFAS